MPFNGIDNHLIFGHVDFNKSLYVSQWRFPVDHCLPHCFESKGRFQTKFQRTFYIIWPSDGQLDLLGNTGQRQVATMGPKTALSMVEKVFLRILLIYAIIWMVF